MPVVQTVSLNVSAAVVYPPDVRVSPATSVKDNKSYRSTVQCLKRGQVMTQPCCAGINDSAFKGKRTCR